MRMIFKAALNGYNNLGDMAKVSIESLLSLIMLIVIAVLIGSFHMSAKKRGSEVAVERWEIYRECMGTESVLKEPHEYCKQKACSIHIEYTHCGIYK